MTCDDTRRRLTAYLDGDLDADGGTLVRVHLRGCAACRQVASDEAALRDGLRALPSLDPPPSLWAGVQARLAEAEAAAARRPRWRRALARWAPAAPRFALGGALAAAAVTTLWWKTHRAVEEPAPIARSGEATQLLQVIDQPPTKIEANGSGQGTAPAPDVVQISPMAAASPCHAPEASDATADLALDATRRSGCYAAEVEAPWLARARSARSGPTSSARRSMTGSRRCGRRWRRRARAGRASARGARWCAISRTRWPATRSSRWRAGDPMRAAAVRWAMLGTPTVAAGTAAAEPGGGAGPGSGPRPAPRTRSGGQSGARRGGQERGTERGAERGAEPRDRRGGRARARLELQPPGRPFKQLEIENPLGDVQVEGHDKATIEIETRKQGPTEEALDRLHVTLASNPDGTVRLTTTVDGGREFRPLPRGAVKLDLIVRAPRDARIDAASIAGALEVRNMDAGGEARHRVGPDPRAQRQRRAVDALDVGPDPADPGVRLGRRADLVRADRSRLDRRREADRVGDRRQDRGPPRAIAQRRADHRGRHDRPRGRGRLRGRLIVASVRGDVNVRTRGNGAIVIRARAPRWISQARRRRPSRTGGSEAQFGPHTAAGPRWSRCDRAWATSASDHRVGDRPADDGSRESRAKLR